MIIGELDLERAQRDPAYLARVKAFLVSGARINATLFYKLPEPPAAPTRKPPNAGNGTGSELGLN
ncbi:MAG: hypothetical protein ISR50_12790 [Alphaproteobacteria bacterium]|nr:hypothetical protein [Alphaproteobacteria bacterium]